MRRVVALMVALALLLTACGGGPPSIDLSAPPESQAVEQIENAQIQQIIDGWKNTVPAEMQQHLVKGETIQEATYRSDADLASIQAFYDAQFPGKSAEWRVVPNMPGLQAEQGFLLTGYETSGGLSNVVVGAIDASKFGDEGVVIYTASGHR